MNRAQFLVAAALASPGLRDVLRRPASAEAAAGPRPGTWDAIRGEFALAPGVTQLSAFLLASHPRPVREAIERHRRGLDANPHGYLDHAASFEERARRSAAQSLGSQPSQVALTDSTTMGLGLLYGGLRLEAGDDVLTTVHDFYSTHAALELRAAATGPACARSPSTAISDTSRRPRSSQASPPLFAPRRVTWRSRGCTRARG